MISRTLLAGLLAGLMAGLVLTVFYVAKTQHIILEAEVFEHGAAAGSHEDAPLARTLYTFMFNLLTGAAFGLILSAVLTLRGKPVGLHRGLLWGAAGFVAFALAPAFGLPPELPGSISVRVEARQLWWLLTTLDTAVGIGLLAFARYWSVRIGGVILILLPHIIGAPHPLSSGGTAPPELAAEFVAVSLGANAVFWMVLGASTGILFDRFGLGQRGATASA